MSDEPSAKRLKPDVETEAGAAEVLEGGAEEAVEELESWAADLDHCQKALDKVNDEASDRVLAVEQEYNKKRRPIYSQRADIIKRVPLFWHKTLTSHPSLLETMSEDDLQVLEYVTELDVVDFDDIKSGFKIVLKFAADNPYFSNPSLTKSFHYGDDGKITIEAPTIDWKDNYAPGTYNYVFFLWLASNETANEGQLDEVAECIKDDIWPNPSKYYFSELPAAEGQDYAEEMEEMEDDGGPLEAEGFEGVLQAGDEGDEGEDGAPLDDPEADVAYDEGEGLAGEGELGGDGLEGALEGAGEEDFGGDDGGEGAL
ncbi:hypothetical protein GPECTOR_4g639 [Gonium pectorale]|uniref:Uncharacterized protein n=1 Tax=Gonium pectorale TaxID=33097 RepID=A0A150GXN0_GONPE|nr:hypothetical protein GPECTOR_4g639 [Gonium pectorale]|eukprot:KXZ54574.1 hypothetical protein GPECTOR_4g639 [Gonium pectorale]